MSASIVFKQVLDILDQHLDNRVDESSRERIALLVLGIIRSKSASPSRIAEAIEELGLTNASAESIERRVRRIENDPEISAITCFHPFARARLAWGRPRELLIILDPTTQDDRVVMVEASVWYRARALPLAWVVWPANQPLQGDRFWKRIDALLSVVENLLPKGTPVTWLADRAFGTPAFIDLIVARGWDYIVRVQDQTLCKDTKGISCCVSELVKRSGQRAKMRGKVFKKYGWRDASVVVFWGRRYEGPLCLVSNLPPKWSLIYTYRRRYPIEATFRNYKSYGWHWEQGQVTDIQHVERLLVGMALATWVVLFAGTQVATEQIAKSPTGKRRTVPWIGKRSLFHLGLQRMCCLLNGSCHISLQWEFTDWDAPNWQQQIYFHHAHAFVALSRKRSLKRTMEGGGVFGCRGELFDNRRSKKE